MVAGAEAAAATKSSARKGTEDGVAEEVARQVVGLSEDRSRRPPHGLGDAAAAEAEAAIAATGEVVVEWQFTSGAPTAAAAVSKLTLRASAAGGVDASMSTLGISRCSCAAALQPTPPASGILGPSRRVRAAASKGGSPHYPR